jgi:hypothetical protein
MINRKTLGLAGRWWLMPVILATWEAEIRRITVKANLGKQFIRPYLGKTEHKTGMVEWLKWRNLSSKLSSNPSTTQKKKKERKTLKLKIKTCLNSTQFK